jgi:hypothetical protein
LDEASDKQFQKATNLTVANLLDPVLLLRKLGRKQAQDDDA